MISLLHIKNFALIEECELYLNHGLNILSGETGAGKSIIIDAISFLLGEKFDKSIIRFNESFAFVEGVFENLNKETCKMLSEMGISFDDDKIIIERQLKSDGKNEYRINNKIVTAGSLKNITSLICDICGQHEHQNLLKSSNHIAILDKFGESTISILKSELQENLQKFKSVNSLIKKFGNIQEVERKIDILNFQIQEIEKANLCKGEDEELFEKIQKLNNMEKISKSLNNIEILLNGEDDKNILESLSRTIKELNYIEKYDSDYPDLIKRLNDCKIELSDISSTISDKAQELFYDEKTLIEAQKRLDEINLLKRKYGNTIEEILNYYDKCSEELFELKSNKDSVQAYENEASAILKRLYSESVELHNERVKCAEVFEKSILKELSDLEIKNASFKVDFKALPEFSENITVNENGLDDLEFLISPNMGQPLKSLSKTASGGEMARIMLAIKNISSDIENINTIIFDEIDTGISGNTAEVVAEKLFMISKGKQVIAVTHLSQLAAMADFHYLIEKKIIDNNTVTTVRLLDDELQIEEIARLAGGVDNNEYSIPHARQMKNKCIIFKNSF